MLLLEVVHLPDKQLTGRASLLQVYPSWTKTLITNNELCININITPGFTSTETTITDFEIYTRSSTRHGESDSVGDLRQVVQAAVYHGLSCTPDTGRSHTISLVEFGVFFDYSQE